MVAPERVPTMGQVELKLKKNYRWLKYFVENKDGDSDPKL